MSTLAPPFTNDFPADSLEKQVYTLVESFAEFIPIANDRNRLGYALFKYMIGEGDSPLVTVQAAKVKLQGISIEAIADKLAAGLAIIRK